MRTQSLSALAVFLTLAASPASAAEPLKADVSCEPTDAKLVYECRIVLAGKKSGAPVEGADIVVGADMPSMAMAHNVRPVKATAMEMPGHYRARIELAMHGEWALRLDVSGPARDLIVHVMHFGGAEAAAGHEMKMDEGSGHKMEEDSGQKMGTGMDHGTKTQD